MDSANILQDFEQQKVNKPLLFLIHTVAALCMALSGKMIVTMMFADLFVLRESHLSKSQPAIPVTDALIERVNLFIQSEAVAGYLGIGIAGILTFSICRKLRLHVLLPVAVLLFSLIVYKFLNIGFMHYVGVLLPGTYISKFIGIVPGALINLVTLLVVVYLLFFSRRIKSGWLSKA